MEENTIIARRLKKNCFHVNAVEPYTIQIKNELLKSVKRARYICNPSGGAEEIYKGKKEE